jgi:hypothetical protein
VLFSTVVLVYFTVVLAYFHLAGGSVAGVEGAIGGWMTRTSHKMSTRTVALLTPMVGLPMTITINTRVVEAKETMTMVTVVCTVGFVAILKVSFMPDVQTKATGGGVDVDSG